MMRTKSKFIPQNIFEPSKVSISKLLNQRGETNLLVALLLFGVLLFSFALLSIKSTEIREMKKRQDESICLKKSIYSLSKLNTRIKNINTLILIAQSGKFFPVTATSAVQLVKFLQKGQDILYFGSKLAFLNIRECNLKAATALLTVNLYEIKKIKLERNILGLAKPEDDDEWTIIPFRKKSIFFMEYNNEGGDFYFKIQKGLDVLPSSFGQVLSS